MCTKPPTPDDPQMSIEEEQSPTRLLCSHQTNDEVHREQEEKKQERFEVPKVQVELFQNNKYPRYLRWNKCQEFRVYINQVNSESEADEICSTLTSTENEHHNGQELTFFYPAKYDKYRARIPNFKILKIQIFQDKDQDGKLIKEATFTRQQIVDLQNMPPCNQHPCMVFEVHADNKYSKLQLPNLIIILNWTKDNGESNTQTLKYALKLSGDCLKNTASERAWPGEACSASVTQRRLMLEDSGFKEMLAEIEDINQVIETLRCSLGVGQRSSTVEPVGELKHLVFYHEEGIDQLIKSLESNNRTNREIARRMKELLVLYTNN